MRVVVSGVRGGLGVSVVAALLSEALARTRPTALVDASGSGSLDLLLGLEHVAGLRWAGFSAGTTAPEPTWALPTWAGVEVLAGASVADLSTQIGRDVLAALAGRCPAVVVDAGAGEFSGQGTRVLVVGTDVVSVTNARSRLAGDPGLVVVRRIRHTALSRREVADALGCAVAATVADDPLLARAVEAGLGPVPGRATRRAIARLTQQLAAIDG